MEGSHGAALLQPDPRAGVFLLSFRALCDIALPRMCHMKVPSLPATV